jgi:branched-chain amino acid transport system ATP-binding protein
MEGRHCFGHLTDRGKPAHRRLHAQRVAAELRREPREGLHYFPRLKTRRNSQAGYTSGGEQQMCAIGRALMAKPEDDPARRAVDGPRAADRRGDLRDREGPQPRKEGVSFLLAEQNTMVALRYADFGYILENGRVVMEGDAKELPPTRTSRSSTSACRRGRKSFRDVKHYRRRKRWLAEA